MSLRLAALARPLAALAPCTNCTFPPSPYPPPIPHIPPLGPSGPPGRAAGRPAVRHRECRPNRDPSTGRRADPIGTARSGEPRGSRTGSTRGSRRGPKNTNFYPISGRSGNHLGPQSTKPWLRMAFSDFTVAFRYYKCPFWCRKSHFHSIFHGFSEDFP